jgi:ribosomal protein L37AE/L43A
MEAVAPGCHYIGNIEYWVCYDCEGVWQDEDLTQVTNIKNVILPALESTATHVAAKDPTCYENGNKEYWYCDECEQVWENEELTALSNIKNVQIGATGHTLKHHEAVAPTCDEVGNVEYWRCETCGAAFLDEAATKPVAKDRWVLGATGHNLKHYAAVAPTCTAEGNLEYWRCETCGAAFLDEAATKPVAKDRWILGKIAHTLTEVDYVAPTATEDGNINYWYCSVCGKYFADAEGTKEITYEETVIPANPETGDTAMVVPAVILALLGVTGTAVLVSKKNLLK